MTDDGWLSKEPGDQEPKIVKIGGVYDRSDSVPKSGVKNSVLLRLLSLLKFVVYLIGSILMSVGKIWGCALVTEVCAKRSDFTKAKLTQPFWVNLERSPY